MPAPETNRQKVVARLKREGWQEEHGSEHDKFKHPSRKGRIIVPAFAGRRPPDRQTGRME